MTTQAQAGEVNQLIERMTRPDRLRLLGCVDACDLRFGDRLCEADSPFDHVYFPLTGFVSLVTTVSGHQPLEMGLIGNEGMLGATLLLGVGVSPLRGVVQGAGRALRLPTARFLRELRQSTSLRSVLSRYLYVLMTQLAQTAACTCFHDIEARLARWLLMTDDRAFDGNFHLTHQLLAEMLGVRRSAVTIAAGALQSAGLIHYTRGDITIVDRRGLERAACECYQAVVNDYAAMFQARR